MSASTQLYHVVLDLFFFNDTATTEIYTLSLHDALPIFHFGADQVLSRGDDVEMREMHVREAGVRERAAVERSEEHTSELQSRLHLVCRLLLEKKKREPTQPLA